MISPGKFWKLIPKELVKNLALRREVLLRAENDTRLQKGFLEMCKQDIRFFINLFVFQFNPAKMGDEVGPFITWDFQDKALMGGWHVNEEGKRIIDYGVIDCIDDQKDVRWQKSRELGASWIVLLAIVWLCLFHERKKALVLSRDEDAVDRADDPDSLFWKIRFIIEHLPDWMTQGVRARSMGIKFSRTNSSIFGEANTVTAGVGGRATVALFDEFGRFKNGYDIYGATASTTNCRIFVFTHDSTASMAYDLCYDEKYSDMREITTHWSQHPDKNRGLYRYDLASNQIEVLDKKHRPNKDFNFQYTEAPLGGPFPGIRSPWYDEQCKRMPERYVAMHLDINPQGASKQFFNHSVIAKLKRKNCVDPYWVGDLIYDKDTAQPIELARNPSGLLRLWCNPREGAKFPPGVYRLGHDVAAGSGATPSCVSGLNSRTGEKILEYANAHIYPTDFAVYCVALARALKTEDGEGAMMCWEIQGSPAFARKVIELGYRNVYYRHDEDAVGVIRDNAKRPGVNTAPKAIVAMLDAYRDALYKGLFINRSEIAMDETLCFVYSSKGVEYKKRGVAIEEDASGAGIHHGDRAKADILCWHIAKTPFQAFQKEESRVDDDWIDPRSMEGRMRLAEDAEREFLIEIGV